MFLQNRKNSMEQLKGFENTFKYVMMPVIGAFIATMILLNVDCAVSVKFKRSNHIASQSQSDIISTKDLGDFAGAKLATEDPSLLTVNCKEVNNNACILECNVQNHARESLNAELKLKFEKCNLKQPMELTLKGTPFGEDASFSKDDLNGEFKLSSLKIDKCNKFSKIQDGAFDKASLNDLKILIIEQKDEMNSIEKITENTFAGLNELKKLHFKNTAAVDLPLKAAGMFTPLAENLEYLRFEQNYNTKNNGYEPGNWFGIAVYTKLEVVDLRNNYLNDTLNGHSFDGLIGVKKLYLAGCSIGNIEENAFKNMEDLNYLDLSNNKLTALDAVILVELSRRSTQLQLLGNLWNCDCSNKNFILYVQDRQLILIDDPRCEGGDEYVKYVNLELLSCESEEVGVTEITTTTTAANIETTKPEETTTELTTKINDETTKTSTITTEAPNTPKPTTDATTNEIVLFCSHNSDELSLQQQFTNFYITSLTSNSVLITFDEALIKHDLFYFATDKLEPSYQQAFESTSLHITTLTSDCTYIFCLINKNFEIMTPFNCRAHHTLSVEPIGWLTSLERPTFLGVTIALTIICFIMGKLFIYFLLRYRPNLMLACRGFSYADMATIRNGSLTMNDDLSKNQKISDDYVKYFKGSALPTKQVRAEIVTENEPPTIQAPGLPATDKLFSISKDSKDAVRVRKKSNDYIRTIRASQLSMSKESLSIPIELPSGAATLPTLEAIGVDEIRNSALVNEENNENEYQSLDECERFYEIMPTKSN